MAIANHITELVGNTPVVKLNRTVPKGAADVYIKLEYFNPGSSLKDRAVLNMIEVADLKPGQTIVEPTSGNTGIGLAWIGNSVAIQLQKTMYNRAMVYSINFRKCDTALVNEGYT